MCTSSSMLPAIGQPAWQAHCFLSDVPCASCLAANVPLRVKVGGEAHLVPAVALGVRRPDLAVEAVGVGRDNHLGHQRRKALAVVRLGRRQRHRAKGAPMEGVLHALRHSQQATG